MTYRQWLIHYRCAREAAVPDIRERLPLSAEAPSASPRRAVRYRIAAVAAAAAVLLCVIGYGVLRSLPSGGGQDPSDGPADTPAVIPVHETVQAVTMLHGGTASAIFAAADSYIGARMVHLSVGLAPEGHENCAGVFYDTRQQTVFCADHIVREALTRQGVAADGVYFHYYHPTLQRVLFTATGGGRPSYCYDIGTDTLHRLPVSLHQCPGNTEMGDTPYVLLHKMGGSRDDLYLVDLANVQVVNILKDSSGRYAYTPMDDGHLSTDGSYVFYTLSEGDADTVNSPARTTVAYHIPTGVSHTFTGEIWAEIPGTARLLIKDPTGFAVYDLATRQTTAFAQAGLPAQYRYYVQKTDLYSEYSYRLMLHDHTTGAKTLLCQEYIAAHVFSADRRYLYYYVRGEAQVRVRDMAAGTEERLPLDEQLVQETEQGETGNCSLWFYLWLEESAGELLLGYSVTAVPREDPETIRQQRESVPYYVFTAFRETGAFTSIAALEPVLRRFPQSVAAYEGEGFIALDYTGLLTDGEMAPGNRQVALESYSDNLFCEISHVNELDSLFSAGETTPLATDAEVRTRALLRELDIPLQPAVQDYGAYFKDGETDELQLRLAPFTGERARQQVSSYYVTEKNGYVGARMHLEEPAELEALWAFLAFTDSLAYERCLGSEEEAAFIHSHSYLVRLCSPRGDAGIWMGTRDGKPFIVKNGCLAYTDAATLAHWEAWADAQEQKGHLD